MKRLLALVLGLCIAISFGWADERSGSVDFFILMDTSLSMADAMADAKRFAAGEVVGRLIVPGDYATVLEFYGQTETLWSGDIRDDADKAALVRSLNGLKADGRFTDIGAALDRLDKLIVARGMPERPKYILLITDERQEAPANSPYYSADYTITHPLLTYVRRMDMGLFRVITIGYGLNARIEGEARSLLTILSEAPSRPETRLPGQSAPGGTTGELYNADSGAQGQSGSLDGQGNAAGQELAGSRAQRLLGSVPWWWYVLALVLIALIVFLVLAFARRKQDDKRERRPRGGV